LAGVRSARWSPPVSIGNTRRCGETVWSRQFTGRIPFTPPAASLRSRHRSARRRNFPALLSSASDSDAMTIVPLSEHPAFLEPLAEATGRAWAHLYRGWGTVMARAELLRQDSLGILPVTFVAVVKGHCAGTVSLIFDDLPGYRPVNPWLASLLVLPDFRGRGVGYSPSPPGNCSRAAAGSLSSRRIATADRCRSCGETWLVGRVRWLPKHKRRTAGAVRLRDRNEREAGTYSAAGSDFSAFGAVSLAFLGAFSALAGATTSVVTSSATARSTHSM
jgi:GNAT superfamily N-acetyltransferase